MDYKVISIGLGVVVFGLLILIARWWFRWILPTKKLWSSIEGVDFQKSSVDLSKIDTLKLKANKSVIGIKNQLQYLVDVLCDRIDRVNEATDKGDHDGLTGCYNMNHLEVYSSSYEQSNSFTVIFFDVNNLKRMNDEYGHEAGDTLLKTAAKKLSYWSDYGDVYRIGGDEFMVVLTNRPTAQIKKLFGKWWPTVGILNRTSDGFKCILSYGIADRQPGEQFEDVRKRADERMYRMKVRVKKQLGEPMR